MVDMVMIVRRAVSAVAVVYTFRHKKSREKSHNLTDSVADDCRVGEPECQKRVTRVDPDVVENRRCVKCER